MSQLQDPGKKDGFTTEALAFAAQYEVSQTFCRLLRSPPSEKEGHGIDWRATFLIDLIVYRLCGCGRST
jgi:hypothetical protein